MKRIGIVFGMLVLLGMISTGTAQCEVRSGELLFLLPMGSGTLPLGDYPNYELQSLGQYKSTFDFGKEIKPGVAISAGVAKTVSRNVAVGGEFAVNFHSVDNAALEAAFRAF